MNWEEWIPRDHATLCFIVKEGRILLIHKKRGLGAGKVNAPGGKIEPGETPLEGAIRETVEEVGVTPLGLSERGVLRFQFADGYGLHCVVFLATDLTGELIETEEAVPFWADLAAIPYQQMWEDDGHWLPHVLAGQTFSAYFEFDGEKMTSKRIEFSSECALSK